MFDYFSAHIFGGSSEEFLKLIRTLDANTKADAAKG
jgi:hypothetical protein